MASEIQGGERAREAAGGDAERPKLAGRKAEAAVNDALILQAAREVLTVEPDTPMAEIAARRRRRRLALPSLPSKEALAYRLCLDGMSALADLARRRIEVIDDDPWSTSSRSRRCDRGRRGLASRVAGTFEADDDLNRVAQQMHA